MIPLDVKAMKARIKDPTTLIVVGIAGRFTINTKNTKTGRIQDLICQIFMVYCK